jgi:SAM-dependent methyltransferase
MPDSLLSQNDPVGANTLQVIASAKDFNQWMYQVIKPFIKGRVLEIGSGIGNISSLLVLHHQKVTLSDINADYCNYLQAKFSQHPSLENITSLDLVIPGFPEKYKDLLNSFDTIILLNVIEHIEDHNRAIQNACSLLSKNGVLIVLAPAYQTLYCPLDKGLGHFRRYTKKSMKLLLTSNGFGVASWTYFNCVGIAGWVIFGKILRRKALEAGEVNLYEFLVPLNKIIDKIMHKITGLSIICVGQKTD